MATHLATTTAFWVRVGRLDLGTFTTCEGLSCDVDYEEFWEGGLNTRPWRLPTRIRYSNVVLTRPLESNSAAYLLWLQSAALKLVPLNGEIAALGPTRTPIVRWELQGVVPVRWQGPSFTAASTGVAMETIELGHHGLIALPG
ncbi:phage tail protein [Nocardia brasiliensis]|uniref:phage tail protein n=1 Tax=Nocardia brasiliensis TaxID=37326 RepID=UPI003D7906C0